MRAKRINPYSIILGPSINDVRTMGGGEEELAQLFLEYPRAIAIVNLRNNLSILGPK